MNEIFSETEKASLCVACRYFYVSLLKEYYCNVPRRNESVGYKRKLDKLKMNCLNYSPKSEETVAQTLLGLNRDTQGGYDSYP